MSAEQTDRTVSASGIIAAPASLIFDLIADPARQTEWDGNENLAQAEPGQRVHAVGDVFRMDLTNGKTRENHIAEFAEGELIAWKPASEGQPPAGHLWRWELSTQPDGNVEVTHTYDWSQLTDEARMERARNTTSEMLGKSVDRLKQLAESLTA